MIRPWKCWQSCLKRRDVFITQWSLRWRSLCPGSCNHNGWDPRTHPSPCCLQRLCRSETAHPGLPLSPPAVQSTSPPDRIVHTQKVQKCNNGSFHNMFFVIHTLSWHRMMILWVRLDYTCTPRGRTGSLGMTDFNNSTEVIAIGPLTPSHKRNNLLSFHSQAAETSYRSQTFLSLFHDNRSRQTRWNQQL